MELTTDSILLTGTLSLNTTNQPTDSIVAILIVEVINIVNVICCGNGFFSCTARDCQDLQYFRFSDSGVYHVIPDGTVTGYDVYCHRETSGGGWLVFQRRLDGSVDFFRGWDDYDTGFGNLTAEHWLGNSALHIITSQGFYELRIELEDWDEHKAFAEYNTFHVSGMKELYNLTVSGFSGDAGDSLSFHNGHVFSTRDRDHSTVLNSNETCATRFTGAWWYNSCHWSNLNGQYLSAILNDTTGAMGITWREWKTQRYSLKKTEMKIRRK